MAKVDVGCTKCGSEKVVKFGVSSSGKQRYCCQNERCKTKKFQLSHIYNAYDPEITSKIIEMTAKASGIRDISKVLKNSRGLSKE